jgi:hypothetical protein
MYIYIYIYKALFPLLQPLSQVMYFYSLFNVLLNKNNYTDSLNFTIHLYIVQCPSEVQTSRAFSLYEESLKINNSYLPSPDSYFSWQVPQAAQREKHKLDSGEKEGEVISPGTETARRTFLGRGLIG